MVAGERRGVTNDVTFVVFHRDRTNPGINLMNLAQTGSGPKWNNSSFKATINSLAVRNRNDDDKTSPSILVCWTLTVFTGRPSPRSGYTRANKGDLSQLTLPPSPLPEFPQPANSHHYNLSSSVDSISYLQSISRSICRILLPFWLHCLYHQKSYCK